MNPDSTLTYTDVAVVIPCFNEEHSIAGVVHDFQVALPDARIIVVDNLSTDKTAQIATLAGAAVMTEPRRGKGYAMRRLFADVEAECYLMVDGDGTYDANSARDLISCVTQGGFDMVVGSRQSQSESPTFRRGHLLGNQILSWIFRVLFSLELTDSLSGYRALSRRFVKSFPTGASGFEVEAELNAHAAFLKVPVCEVATPYRARVSGSASKLNTYRDGWRILRRNVALFRDARPAMAFFLLSLPWFIGGLVLSIPPVLDYLETGLVERFPSLIVGTGLLIIGTLSFVAGLVMQRTALNRVEVCRLFYLSYKSPYSTRSKTKCLKNSQTH